MKISDIIGGIAIAVQGARVTEDGRGLSQFRSNVTRCMEYSLGEIWRRIVKQIA